MNKNDLVSAVAGDADLSKADAGRAVDAVFASIEKSLTSDGEVRIVGFGSFSVDCDVKKTTMRRGSARELLDQLKPLDDSVLDIHIVPHGQ